MGDAQEIYAKRGKDASAAANGEGIRWMNQRSGM